MIDFIIIAFTIIPVIRGMSRLQKKNEAAPAEPPPLEKLPAEIRDLLKKQDRHGV